MTIEVVRATLEHANLIAPLFDAYRMFYKQASDVDAAREFIQARLERNESVIFLALDAGVPVGFTQLYPLFSSTRMRRLWLLNDLFVAPEGRGGGVGRMLLERVRQHAVETNAEGLELATAIDNHGAQALYESIGYQRDTRFYHYYLHV